MIFRLWCRITDKYSIVYSVFNMRRGRRKQINPNKIETPQTKADIKVENNVDYCQDTIKLEPLDDEQQDVKINLNRFKFQKKPAVKIEFENDETLEVKAEPKGLWEPPHWNLFLNNLRVMRCKNDAPVDSMGCHMTMDENAPPKVIRYQTLISLMLSSQTKDQVTFAAMEKLKKRGLSVENVLAMSDDELGKLIYPVGFWKTKVKYIKKTTQTLKDQYDSDIPDSVEKLCKLTGVGPKMAHICMKVAWNKITGIGVDTHVHRISNRIGWVKKTTGTPEETRKALESWLPFDLWSEVNHLMVGFGQTICLPLGPSCDKCLNKDICPSSGKLKRSPNKKSPMKKNLEETLIKDIVENKLKIKIEPLDEEIPQSLENEKLNAQTLSSEEIYLKSEIKAPQNIVGSNKTISVLEQVHLKRKSPKNKKQIDESNSLVDKNKKTMPAKKLKT